MSLDDVVAMWKQESHNRQFNGEDYQRICWDLLNYSPLADRFGITADSDDVWSEVQSAPNPYCDCGFCETADWVDTF
jgi:hypothetical protein